jgi:hypothetical protein
VESLALVVALILGYTFVALIAMIITWRKTPSSPLVRSILIVLYLPAIYIGARLAFQDIPFGTRVFGAAVVGFGMVNLLKLIRRPHSPRR